MHNINPIKIELKAIFLAPFRFITSQNKKILNKNKFSKYAIQKLNQIKYLLRKKLILKINKEININLPSFIKIP